MFTRLGKQKFVGLCIHGTNGWQDGVSFLVFIFNFNVQLIFLCFSVLHFISFSVLFIFFEFHCHV